jgi:hypothetical protein
MRDSQTYLRCLKLAELGAEELCLDLHRWRQKIQLTKKCSLARSGRPKYDKFGLEVSQPPENVDGSAIVILNSAATYQTLPCITVHTTFL